MRSFGLSCAAGLAVLASLLSAPAAAQWLNYPTPGTPRLPDGTPDLSAPAPRTADGKPDLSGVWRGAGPFYRFNIAEDLNAEDVQPWAEALFLQRVRDSRKDSPLARCLPVSIPFHNFFNLTRIVQTPGLIVILYESPNGPHRTVFTDGRDLPKDPNPTWLGYSVGRWEGDTLVVTTAGFNDKAWLDSAGHPQTESLRITERLWRRDFGHMDFEMTIDDPKVFTRPFTVKKVRLLAPDTELLEDVCENERDGAHLSGDSGIRLSPELLATYAGVYELPSGRTVVVRVSGDMLFVQGLNEPKLPLLVQSETQFMSTANPTGFEFVKNAQGKVTHLVVRGAEGDQKAVRKGAPDQQR
jgi:uncharacterized protein DUF3471